MWIVIAIVSVILLVAYRFYDYIKTYLIPIDLNVFNHAKGDDGKLYTFFQVTLQSGYLINKKAYRFEGIIIDGRHYLHDEIKQLLSITRKDVFLKNYFINGSEYTYDLGAAKTTIKFRLLTQLPPFTTVPEF